MNRSSLLIVLLFLILAGIIVYFLALPSMNEMVYYLQVKDGLYIDPRSPVRFKGTLIGNIQSIKPYNSGFIFKIKAVSKVQLPKELRVINYYDGRDYGLLLEPISPGEYLNPGDTLVIDTITFRSEIGGKSTDIIQDVSESLTLYRSILDTTLTTITYLNRYLKNLQLLLKGSSNLGGSVNNLNRSNQELTKLIEKMTNFLNESQGNLQKLFELQRSSLEQLRSSSEMINRRMEKILENSEKSSEQMLTYSSRMVQISARIETAVERLQSDSSSLGRLMKDDSLYQELKATFKELHEIVREIRKNPRAFFSPSSF